MVPVSPRLPSKRSAQTRRSPKIADHSRNPEALSPSVKIDCVRTVWSRFYGDREQRRRRQYGDFDHADGSCHLLAFTSSLKNGRVICERGDLPPMSKRKVRGGNPAGARRPAFPSRVASCSIPSRTLSRRLRPRHSGPMEHEGTTMGAAKAGSSTTALPIGRSGRRDMVTSVAKSDSI